MNRKLKASSIYYALFLSIVIALILGGMVLFSGVTRQFTSSLEVEEILMDNAVSGMEYAQANFAELPESQAVFVRLFGEGIDSVQLKRKPWGAFTILESKALHGRTSFMRIALTGQVSSPDDPNLFVADLGRPIAICGETRLEGKLALPESGVKRAYIEGKNYVGDKLLYGEKLTSNRNLPPVNELFVNGFTTVTGDLKPWDKNMDTLQVSFAESGVHFVSDSYASIQGMTLEGQIVIESRDSIFVGSDADLSNVILKSPVVYFEEGFTGTVQVFATERIVLENKVLLKYPSVLGLIEEEFPKEEQAEIRLGEQSQVIGSVFLFSRNENFRLPVQLTVGKEAAIDGFAYCKGKTQLEGTVNGHLYTERFYLKTKSSTYENHLLDASITDALPDEFVYIPLLNSTNRLTRISWLN